MTDAQENVQDSSSDFDVTDVDDENSSTLLYVNRFLPFAERESIPGETRDTEEDLLEAIRHLNAEVETSEEVSVKTVGRVIKLINFRLSLKYYFSVSALSICLYSCTCSVFICALFLISG